MTHINKLLTILMFSTSITCYAFVPISTMSDPAALAAAAQAASQASTYMQQIQQATSVVDQIKGLKGLQQLKAGGEGLCQLCNKTDQKQLEKYVNSIDEDLCSQFSNAMSNMDASAKGFKNLSSIISSLSGTNPQAASLSLAQSSANTLQNVNSTLAQMQMMQAQTMQKQLAQEKLQKQTAQTMAASIQKSPL